MSTILTMYCYGNKPTMMRAVAHAGADYGAKDANAD